MYKMAYVFILIQNVDFVVQMLLSWVYWLHLTNTDFHLLFAQLC